MSSYAYVYLEKFDYEQKRWKLYNLYDYDEKAREYIPLPLWEGQGLIRDFLSSPDTLLFDYSNAVVTDNRADLRCVSSELIDLLTNDLFSVESMPIYSINMGIFGLFLEQHPTIYDVEEDEDDPYKRGIIDNPLKMIYDRALMVIDSKGDLFVEYSRLDDYRIIYFVSW